jgi:hypothetical protein
MEQYIPKYADKVVYSDEEYVAIYRMKQLFILAPDLSEVLYSMMDHYLVDEYLAETEAEQIIEDMKNNSD